MGWLLDEGKALSLQIELNDLATTKQPVNSIAN
jgi:hypothetical protein